jgi:hypothetical protein
MVPAKGKEPVATKNKDSIAPSTTTTTTITTASSAGGRLTLDWSKAKSRDVKKFDQPKKEEAVAKPENEDKKGSASVDVRPKPDVKSKSEEKVKTPQISSFSCLIVRHPCLFIISVVRNASPIPLPRPTPRM